MRVEVLMGNIFLLLLSEQCDEKSPSKLLKGYVDKTSGCVRAKPFQDAQGKWLEWIPWDEL